MTTKERLDKYFGASPRIHPDAYVSPHAVIIGDVKVGAKSSIWPSVVMRADINSIEVGECSNVQDGTMVHLADDYGVKIGDYTTVGHGAILHACEIGNETLIGMGATILDGAKIGNQCVIGACSLVTKGTIIPDGSVVMGIPAKVVKTMDLKARSKIRDWAVKYLEVAQTHKEYFQDMGFQCADTPADYADKCFARGEDVPEEFTQHKCRCGGHHHHEHECCFGGHHDEGEHHCHCHDNDDCDGNHHAKGECKCKKEAKSTKKSAKKCSKATKKSPKSTKK